MHIMKAGIDQIVHHKMHIMKAGIDQIVHHKMHIMKAGIDQIVHHKMHIMKAGIDQIVHHKMHIMKAGIDQIVHHKMHIMKAYRFNDDSHALMDYKLSLKGPNLRDFIDFEHDKFQLLSIMLTNCHNGDTLMLHRVIVFTMFFAFCLYANIKI